MSLQLKWLAGSRRGLMDGVVSTAYFDTPSCASTAPDGEIWIVDKGNVRVRKMSDFTVVTSLTGAVGSPYQTAASGRLQGADVPFTHPSHLCHGTQGDVYVIDESGRLRKMVGGHIFTVVQHDLKKYVEGWGITLSLPQTVQMDHTGSMWVAATGECSVVQLFKGGSKKFGPGYGRSFVKPFDVAFLPRFSPHVFVADDNKVLMLSRADGLIEDYAGASTEGYLDGFRTIAQFRSCNRLLACPNGDLLVSDVLNQAIRKISVSGMVTTLIGGGDDAAIFGIPAGLTLAPLPQSSEARPQGNSKPIIEGKLVAPLSCCWTKDGDLIIPDSGQHILLMVEMAHVPEQIRLKLGYCMREDLTRLNMQFRTLTHKSGQSWTIFDPIIALASSTLLQPGIVASYLENSDVSPESIEMLLQLMVGTVPDAAGDSASTFPFAIGTLRLLIHLKLWDLLETFRPHMVAWSQHLDIKTRMSYLNQAEGDFMFALQSSTDDKECEEARILFQIMRSITKAFLVLGELEVIEESPVWGQRPYYGAGFLREQLERLYWTTIGGLGAGDKPLLTVKANELPEYLLPNLEIVTHDGSVSCHDWVLCGRWRFVKNMFLFSGAETESRKVSLEDVGITTAALQYIIYFMYTDRVDLLTDQSLCLSILKWCHELHLANLDDSPISGSERLIKHCTKPFTQPISLENAIPIYRAAIEGGSVEHEKRALDFIARRLKPMMESDRRCAELRTLSPEVLTSVMFAHFGRIWPEASSPAHAEKR